MKNKILYILIGMFTIMSCKIDDLNDSSKEVKIAPPEFVLTSAQKSLFDALVTHGVFENHFRLFSQYFAGTDFLSDQTNFINLNSFPTNFWLELNRNVLSDLELASQTLADNPITGEPVEITQNKNSILEVLKIFTYHVLVDSYGDIPYSEAIDIENLTPKYDDAKDIYTDIIARLDNAINLFDSGFGSFGEADVMYQGDISKWIKFANSLKLRLALRIADVDGTKASTMASEAVNGGVFSSNDDNATLAYEEASPNRNPAWFEIINRGRTDYVASEIIVNTMLPINDPRLSIYLDDNVSPFVGGPFGSINEYEDFSHIGSAVLNPSQEGVIMDYAEVEFLLAEAAERSLAGTSTDAEAHYNAAITASLEYWEATDVDNDPNTDDVAIYLANPGVAYTTASGTWQEKIGTQKWIALFNRGFEGWSSYRRLGFPDLPNTSGGNPVPRRVIYPIREYNTNNNNVSGAASKIGGDLLTTKVFWDAN
ncbi:SusD/RagB family nutrient-binding outer membrane lipoprotein [Aquimarina sp. 2201CG1-2-11]|uniref:SusD/RagB family nutrient-binding outer membrane lipoprotein n=1 Tax=Aquimarina discodermiae TaxID=3231043 RepID=UPI00346321ED